MSKQRTGKQVGTQGRGVCVPELSVPWKEEERKGGRERGEEGGGDQGEIGGWSIRYIVRAVWHKLTRSPVRPRRLGPTCVATQPSYTRSMISVCSTYTLVVVVPDLTIVTTRSSSTTSRDRDGGEKRVFWETRKETGHIDTHTHTHTSCRSRRSMTFAPDPPLHISSLPRARRSPACLSDWESGPGRDAERGCGDGRVQGVARSSPGSTYGM